jgi:DNA mismatch repair protein MutL
MSLIKILSENVSNKIAAGEVIERPASVVKELVENSIDAGACKIFVTIEKAGKKLICVSDNGCGMDPDDALLSLEAHATSKIKTEEDISRITTMGFRGEALPSIASVSRLRLKTKQKLGTVGTELIVNGGRFIKENPVGCAPGTEIYVADLFFNIPARKKFLKTDSTEEKHIYETVCLLALANYKVSFELKVDGRIVISSPGNEELLPRICDFLGRNLSNKFIKVNSIVNDITVSGYVSNPGVVRNNRREQRVFINNRPIKTNLVYSAISEAYNTMIMKGVYPIATLYISLPPDKVDINVHPAKHEARFQNGQQVKSVVKDAISKSLREALKPVESVKQAEVSFSSILSSAQIDYSSKAKTENKNNPENLFSYSSEVDLSQSKIPACPDNRKDNNKTSIDAVGLLKKTSVKKSTIEAAVDTDLGVNKLSLPGCDNIIFIDFLDKTYILCHSNEGLLVVDQHAAHERILFEKLLNDSGRDIISQKLLLPITIDLSVKEYHFITKNVVHFNNLGFDLESFGNNTVMLTAIPVTFPMNNISGLISDMIEDIIIDSSKKNVDEHVIARTACKFAVKANDTLTKIEAEEMIKDLSKCELPFSCPHGRPTVINISYKELEKRFGRKS